MDPKRGQMMFQVPRMVKRFILVHYQQLFSEQNISSKFLSSLEFQIALSKVILWFCLAIISALILLHRQYYEAIESVPFKGYVVFVICIMFCVAGAFSTLLIGHKPKLALLRQCYFIFSIVSMTSALSILGYALFL